MRATNNAIVSNIEATQGPSFGGGYRVAIVKGSREIATRHFPVPPSHRTWEKVLVGIELAYIAATAYASGFDSQ